MKISTIAELLGRMAREYEAKRSIFEIPESCFSKAFALEARSPGIRVMSGKVSLPVGPAAGPHSQIAPNLVASYLAGSRVFELKTVQENDSLDIEKPCIEALDEGHNVEWSTELSLVEAREEYLRGWIAIHILAAVFSARPREFIFNMSVGYTLDGIKGKKVDAYIEGMRNPGRTAFWFEALKEAEGLVRSPVFTAAFGSPAQARAAALFAAFPARPVHSVTLSTMHGCPPAEIERIGRYLIVDKGFDTYVKLNPTLVSYDRARAILDGLGWTDIVLKRESFEHDLQFPDALKLIANLKAAAEDSGREFGIKLSNTLANANSGTFLPGAERYMSGRALFPITVALAADLAAALPDFGARFSYCGGVSALNAAELVGAGMAPLTIATDILKPGGYQRLLAVAEKAVGVLTAEGGAPGAADAAALASLAEAAKTRREYRKDWKEGRASIAKPLPIFDCFAAPCIEACPVHQKVPAYIQASASGESAQALATILSDNPLPHITGVLCDHVCQEHCSRVDYEGSVRIRDVKLACARAGKEAGYASDSAAAIAARILPEAAVAAAAHGPVAVVGAGPAGLACAHHLALAGMAVTVFDGARRPGGVPVNVIPKFRIDRQDIAADMGRIEALGVKFETGRAIATAQELRASGYRAIFLGIGADSARSLGLAGSGIREVDALEFLGTLSENPGAFEGARHIVVAGGGNTAMDAVRSATRVRGVKDVKLSYRRTTAEMPADREELENALAEAAALAGPDSNSLFALTLPESAVPGRLTLRKMVLGDRDASGRHSPLPSAETLELDCDLIVSAIGESPDGEVLAAFGLNLGKDGRPLADPQTMMAAPGVYVGGDARRGPASIIAAEADGRRAAYAILRAAGIEPPAEGYVPPPAEPAVLARRGDTLPSLDPSDPDFVAREAERCLKCDSACLRCVEVCPNRANAFVEVGAPFAQGMQIVHVDRLCNECGNCGVFCPYEGEPYRAKPTVFDTTAELEASKNPGFAFVEPPGFPKSGKRGPAAPDLALRNDRASSVRRYSHAEWNGANLPSGSESMISLARAVWRGHRYLVGGMK